MNKELKKKAEKWTHLTNNKGLGEYILQLEQTNKKNQEIVDRLREKLKDMDRLCNCGCHSDKVLLQKILGDTE